MAFLKHFEQCSSPNKVTFISQIHPLGSRNSNFFVKHAQNLNTHTEKFGELGLTVGI